MVVSWIRSRISWGGLVPRGVSREVCKKSIDFVRPKAMKSDQAGAGQDASVLLKEIRRDGVIQGTIKHCIYDARVRRGRLPPDEARHHHVRVHNVDWHGKDLQETTAECSAAPHPVANSFLKRDSIGFSRIQSSLRSSLGDNTLYRLCLRDSAHVKTLLDN